MKKALDGVWLGIGAIVIAACVVICLTAQPGYVYQSEFSPDTLTFRSKNYYFFEFLSLPHEYSNPVLERIREFDDDSVPPSSPPRWHFVHGDKAGVRGWHGNAKNVYRAFHDSSWIDWTDQHPDLAKRLWPEILCLIRREQYSQVRQVMMFARNAKTLDEIDRAIEEAAKD